MGSAIVLIVSDRAVLCSFEFSLTIEGFTGLDEAGEGSSLPLSPRSSSTNPISPTPRPNCTGLVRCPATNDPAEADTASGIAEKYYPVHSGKVGGLLWRLALTFGGLALTLLATLAAWSFWFRRPTATRRVTSAEVQAPRMVSGTSNLRSSNDCFQAGRLQRGGPGPRTDGPPVRRSN
jgi:hypothetical protein